VTLRSLFRLVVGAGAASLLAASCASPLPEAGTPAAELYLRRCGTCHVPYRPGLMTAAMWGTMVDRMAVEMDRRGLALTEDEKQEILGYLTRNSGG